LQVNIANTYRIRGPARVRKEPFIKNAQIKFLKFHKDLQNVNCLGDQFGIISGCFKDVCVPKGFRKVP